jgi:hypothetical protein
MKLANGFTIHSIPDLSRATDEQKQMGKKWIEALESKKYTQGQAVLKSTTRNPEIRHCCLGVAGEIMVQEGFCKWKSYATDQYEHLFDEQGEKSYGVLPDSVVLRFGLVSPTGFNIRGRHEDGEEQFYDLTNLNDRGLATFGQIAEILSIAYQGGLNPETLGPVS